MNASRSAAVRASKPSRTLFFRASKSGMLLPDSDIWSRLILVILFLLILLAIFSRLNRATRVPKGGGGGNLLRSRAAPAPQMMACRNCRCQFQQPRIVSTNTERGGAKETGVALAGKCDSGSVWYRRLPGRG